MEDLNALMKMMGKPTPMERLINFIDDAIDEVMEKLENNKYGFNEEQVWKLIKKSKFYDEDIYKEILKERCITLGKQRLDILKLSLQVTMSIYLASLVINRPWKNRLEKFIL